MDGRIALIAAGLILSAGNGIARGESSELRRSWQADAALHDVQCVSTRVAWAVGEHGSLWQTNDGGKSWELGNTGSLATFRSVCLLTDQIGWIAGWQTRGSAELATAVLLMTRDGGRSWIPLDASSLSPLRYVRFFGLEEGIVIGEPTRDNATGVWGTNDGGKSWLPIAGPPTRGWNHAALASPELGLLADRDGNVTLLAGPQLLPSKLPVLKGRSIRGVAMSNENRGWLVGDGGLVLTSASGGVMWESPETDLPADLRELADFHSVAVKDDAVWLAGSPGGIIWHSPDAGKHWVKQPTGVTTPIRKFHFLNARHGCAVGDLGVILTTQDGGETWTVARGRGRHVAVLSLHHRVSSVSLESTAKLSGDQGFRSAALIMTRPPEAAGPLSVADRLQDAVGQCGGSSGAAAWTLPLDIPGLDLHSERLLANWTRRTEGRLPQVLLGGLVRQIRMWRPHVLIVDQPAPEDAAGQLLYDAALQAIQQAGDGTRFIVQRELGGLPAWKVDRVYLHLLPGSTGEIAIDPFEYLPRWQTNARMATAASRALLAADSTIIDRPNFRAIDLDGAPSPQDRGSDLFGGLSLPAGGDVRRAVFPINDQHLDQQIKAAQRQRNFLAQAERAKEDPRLANQMLAQLNEVTAAMTPEQAALTLAELREEYCRQGRWDLAEATAQELMRRFPEEPPTADAARWLLTYFVSAEVAWQRARQANSDGPANLNDIRISKKHVIKQAGYQANLTKFPDLKERLNKANQVVRQIEHHWPALAASPAVEFPLATLSRARGSQTHSDNVYRRWLSVFEENDHRDWTDAVRREIWVSQIAPEVPAGVANCLRTSTKPQLDGIFSDDCWQQAPEISLAFRFPGAMPDVPPPLVMLAYDDEFLYLAASVARIDGQSTDKAETAGRTHDADLRQHDRLTFLLDVDRDYQTWYSFHVDQRGWTAESCWDDARFNPRWFVAADGDANHWRIELAIPWTELTPKRPDPNSAWGLSLERTAPAAGRQTWTRPSPTRQTGATLGLLRFE